MCELHRELKAGSTKGLVGLTFDDAYENFLQHALPILEESGFSATVFAVAGLIGRENTWAHSFAPVPRMKLLGVDGLRELMERGIEIGSHSMSHPKVGGLDPEALDKEVAGSRRVLSEVLDAQVYGFCYPYGSLDSAAAQAARRAGYAYACAYKKRVEQSVYDWPRMFVGERDSALRLTVKRAAYSPYAKITAKIGGDPV